MSRLILNLKVKLMNRRNIVFIIIPAVSILLILILWFSLGTVFRQGTVERPKIVAILKTTERVVDFWKVLEQGIFQAAEDFEVDIEMTGPSKEGNIDEQIEIINRAIDSKPDVIILAAADYNKLVSPVERAVSLGIPVLTVDSFVNSDAPLSQIGTANFEAGGKLAVYLKEKLPEKSKLGILSYVRESSTAIEREQGLRAGVSGYFEVMPTLYNNDNIETAAQHLIGLQQLDSPPEAIVALNEVTARGILSGLSAINKPATSIFLTFDSNINIIESIENGQIDGTIVQKPYNMGYQAVKTAVNLLNGETPSKKIDTGSELVTSENLFSPVIQKLIFPTGSSNE
ncbi:MAG TPA: hypothetical protein DCO79_09835 [Spirochaeta sp.]|nr:hypothetical protein [Spirochaeta sp.]